MKYFSPCGTKLLKPSQLGYTYSIEHREMGNEYLADNFVKFKDGNGGFSSSRIESPFNETKTIKTCVMLRKEMTSSPSGPRIKDCFIGKKLDRTKGRGKPREERHES
eukprot:sb/3477739/